MPIKGKSTVQGLTVRPARQARQKGKPFKYSNFFITISTNYKAKTDLDFFSFQEKFVNGLEELFDLENMGDNFIDFIGEHAGDSWGDRYIEDVSANTNVEEGTSKYGGRVHSHTLLEIVHRSKIRVDPERIKEFLFPFLRPEVKTASAIFVKIALVSAAAKDVLQYIRKQQHEPEIALGDPIIARMANLNLQQE